MDFGKALETAMDRTRRILFQPFDIGKWFLIGFTAWLANLTQWHFAYNQNFNNHGENASHASSRFSHGFDTLDALLNLTRGHGYSFANLGGAFTVHGKSISHAAPGFGGLNSLFAVEHLALWITLAAVAIAVAITIGIVLMWLGCRGSFMFLDNVVHNRQEISEPWRKYRVAANSLLKVKILILLVSVVLALISIGEFLPFYWKFDMPNTSGIPALAIVTILALFVLTLAVWIAWGFAMFIYGEFAAPVMYATGCSGEEALWRILHLLKANPLACFLYLLIRFAMGILFFLITVIVGLITCCVGFLPYISTVITLPLWVFALCFTLDCLGQLDPGCDILRRASPPPLPAQIPPPPPL